MRASNADVVAKEIQEYKAEVERKLKGMVARFAYAATETLSENTPIGNDADIEAGKLGGDLGQKKYYKFYKDRFDDFQIEAKAGFHRGAYGYSEGGTFTFNPEINSADDAANAVQMEALSSYNIGDTFFIGAIGPGYYNLEKGKSTQAPDGILTPSLDEISEVYKSDMKSFYDAA